MTSTNIIKATLNDLEKLQKIGKQTFVETFSAVNTAENMAKYLEENLSLEQLLLELNDSNTAFYFYLNNNDVVGYLKLNTGVAQTELKDNQSLEIEKIYVLKAFHEKILDNSFSKKPFKKLKRYMQLMFG
jgi:hypothetical protein